MSAKRSSGGRKDTTETPELPQPEMHATARILAGLRTAGIEVEKSEWRYIPKLQQWQFFVKTAWVERHGENTILRAQNDALTNARIDIDIASRVRLEWE
jgi:hypothetical protein